MKAVTISLPDVLLTKVDEIAKKWHINRSEFIREALVSYFESSVRDGQILKNQELILLKMSILEAQYENISTKNL